MKNSLLILSLIILWISLTWCQKQGNIEACSATNGSCTNTKEYLVWEQICIDYNGQISETEDGSKICILNDNDFCYLEDLQNWWCDLLPPQPECTEEWSPVCWKDWNTYNNRCLLEAAWIEEDTQAEVTENWCVFW